MNLNKSEIRSILSKLYQRACLDSECDMRAIVNVFENLTDIHLSNPTLLAWTKVRFDEKRLGHPPYLQLIRSFRNEINSFYGNKAVEEIRNIEKSDKKLAFSKWYECYTDALLIFQWEVINILFQEKFSFEKQDNKKIESFAKLNKLVEDNKWADSITFFIDLSNDHQLPDWKKVYFSNYVSEIFLYHFGYVDKAQEWQQKIKNLIPDHFLAERLQGEIDLYNKNLSSARNLFLNSISMESNNVDSYLFMGETFLDEDPDTSKQWYLDGINVNFLNPSPYSSLFKLFGTAKWIEDRPEEFSFYIARLEEAEIRAVKTVDLYNAYRDVAYAYNLQENVTESESYYLKAISLRPDLTAAKLDLGYIFANKSKFDEAESYFREALLQLGDSPFEALWALGWLGEQRGDLDAAIFYYQKCIGLRKYGEDRIHNVIGLQHFVKKDYTSAIVEFERAIGKNPSQIIYFDNLKDAAEKTGIFEKMEIYHDLVTQHFPQNHIYNNNAGVYFYEKGDFDKAIKLYSKAIEIEPNSELYHKNRGLAFQRSDKLDRAESDFLKALSLASNPAYKTPEQSKREFDDALKFRDADLLNSIGLVKYLREKYEESIPFYSQAIDLDGSILIYRENRAKSYENLALYEEAIDDYKKVLEYEPDPFLFNAIGRIEYWMKNYESAIEYYSKAMELAPNEIVFLQNRALAYQDSGKFDEAEKDYLTSLSLGEDIKSLNALGIIASDRNDQEKAIEYFSKAINIVDNQAILYENRAISLEKIEKFELAKSDLLKAVELDATHLRNNHIGLLYYKEGNYSKAIDFYDKAIESKPDEPVYLENRALAYLFLENLDFAERDFKEAVKLNHSTNSLNYLGIIYFRKNAFDQAIEYYSRAIDQDKNQAILWENRALCWESMGENQKAEDDIMKALEIELTSNRFNFLGLARFKQFDYKSSIEFYSKALEMDQSNPIIWENRALAYEFSSQYSEAILDYEKCLQLREDSFIYNKIGEVYKLLGNYPEAKLKFKKAVDLSPDNPTYLQNLNDCI